MQTFLHQKMFFTMSKEGYVFEDVGVFFTFANQIVTGERVERSSRSVGGNIRLGKYVSRQYFNKGDWFGKAFFSLKDLIVMWVLFALMTIMSVIHSISDRTVYLFVYMYDWVESCVEETFIFVLCKWLAPYQVFCN